MSTFELSSILFQIPSDAYILLSQILIGRSILSQEYRKLIGWYWKNYEEPYYYIDFVAWDRLSVCFGSQAIDTVL